MVRFLLLALAFVVVLPVLADVGNNDRSDKVRVKKPAKMRMLFFYIDRCPYRARLEAKIFGDEKVRQFLAQRVTVTYVNFQANKNLTEQYQVRLLPTLLFLDPTGKDIGRLEGISDEADYLAEVAKILK